jgi:hypothetical protein
MIKWQMKSRWKQQVRNGVTQKKKMIWKEIQEEEQQLQKVRQRGLVVRISMYE